MSTYNEPIEYIAESVNSILQQTYKKIEFIIVIDNPKRKDLIRYLKNIAAKEQRIKLILNNKNIGLTASLNIAIKNANGEYIARMDADDISEPDRLEAELKYLMEHKCQLVGSFTQNIDKKGEIISGKINYYPKNDKIIKKYLRYNSPLAHPTWLGKTSLFKKYAYIDFEACEDYEFLTRVALDGCKLGNVDKPLLKYRINDSGISSNKRAKQKMSLFYISRNYRQKRKSDFSEYVAYKDSNEGKSYLGKIESYYEMVDEMEMLRKNKKYASIPFILVKEILLNNIAAQKIYFSIRCAELRRKDKRINK